MSILDYKFTYGMVKIIANCVGGLMIDFHGGPTMVTKQDVIALAKHFELTQEDL